MTTSVVRYEVFREKRSIESPVADSGSATFNIVSPQGTKTENNTPQQDGGSGDGRRNAERPSQPPDELLRFSSASSSCKRIQSVSVLRSSSAACSHRPLHETFTMQEFA